MASVIVAGTLALAATGASGRAPAEPTSIPDTAFQPVSLPSPAAGAAQAAAAQAAAAPSLVPSPDLRPFAEAWPSTAPLERPQPSVPESDAIVVVRPTPTPQPTPKPQPATGGTLSGSASGGHQISGLASWYCRAGYSICTTGYPDGPGFDAYAAAGPKLRAALGSGWRGRLVTVDGIRVKLIDWCQCYKGESHEKLIDLYYDVFARTGSRVTVRW